jgi:hypothetical protein
MSALGLRIRERVMRRHYGLVLCREFRPGDPSHLKYLDKEGIPRCDKALTWFAEMVLFCSSQWLNFLGQTNSP